MFNLVKVVFYITEIQSASGLVISHKIINFSSYPLTLLLVFFTQLFYLFIKERQILWKEIQWWHHQSFSLAGKWKNCLTEWLIIIDLTSAPLYIIIIFFCKAVPFFTYGKQPDGSYTFGGIVYDLLQDAQNYLDIRLDLIFCPQVRGEISCFILFWRYEFIIIDEALVKKYGRTATLLKYLAEKVCILNYILNNNSNFFSFVIIWRM